MKINNQPPAASVQPPMPVRELRKKVLLFTTCGDSGLRLAREIKKEGDDIVVETADDLDQLVREIASNTPHLLVAHFQDEAGVVLKIREAIVSYFPDLPICLLPNDLSQNPQAWLQALREALAEPIQAKAPREYSADMRYVIHDESLHAFWKGKLNRPQQQPGWEKVCSQQEARFLLQLQTARRNHAAAKHYYQCLVQQQTGLDQELSYRLVHGSYKALSWSRDLAAKWLALLAHYVPDAELEYLPIAGTPGPAIDYVHHNMPTEGVYAATLILCSLVKPALAEAIKQTVASRFDQQDELSLLELSLRLYGVAKMLEQVGRAQVELMDAWLDPSIVDRANGLNIERGERRNAGIYRDFHDLGFIIQSPEPLGSILRGFHAGTTYVEERRYLPSFAEFRRLAQGKELPEQQAKD